VEHYCNEQVLFRSDDTPDPEYSDKLDLDLDSVEPSLAGPKRPQDRVPLNEMQRSFRLALTTPRTERGYELAVSSLSQKATIGSNGSQAEMGHGAVVIAAITSCTNTSNPSVMIAAGLLAKKAIERGLKVKPYVKTSLAPGSRVVTDYYEKAGLLEPLAELGFDVVGYGCTCIGNSGPLSDEVVQAITSVDLVAAAVLSGNRNFEGASSHVRHSHRLPPLVIAYALAGTVDIDLVNDRSGWIRKEAGLPAKSANQRRDQATIAQSVQPEMFRSSTLACSVAARPGNAIEAKESELYPDRRLPSMSAPLKAGVTPSDRDIRRAMLAMLGDDHHRPYLPGRVDPGQQPGRQVPDRAGATRDFNSYSSRRSNDQVMTPVTLPISV
jgi:aconitate hydratase